MVWSLPSKKFIVSSCQPSAAKAGDTTALTLVGENTTGRHGAHLDWRVYLWPEGAAAVPGQDPSIKGAIAAANVTYTRVDASSDDFVITADVTVPAPGRYQVSAGWAEAQPQSGVFGQLEPVDSGADGWFEVSA